VAEPLRSVETERLQPTVAEHLAHLSATDIQSEHITSFAAPKLYIMAPEPAPATACRQMLTQLLTEKVGTV
jgi:hypothetical protein